MTWPHGGETVNLTAAGNGLQRAAMALNTNADVSGSGPTLDSIISVEVTNSGRMDTYTV